MFSSEMKSWLCNNLDEVIAALVEANSIVAREQNDISCVNIKALTTRDVSRIALHKKFHGYWIELS